MIYTFTYLYETIVLLDLLPQMNVDTTGSGSTSLFKEMIKMYYIYQPPTARRPTPLVLVPLFVLISQHQKFVLMVGVLWTWPPPPPIKIKSVDGTLK